MSFTSDLSVNDGQATPVAHTFSVTSTRPDGTDRIDQISTITEPNMLSIKHSTSGSAKTIITDRHLASAALTRKNAAGVAQTVVVNFTIAVPRDTIITRALINDAVAYARNVLGTTAAMDKFLRGES